MPWGSWLFSKPVNPVLTFTSSWHPTWASQHDWRLPKSSIRAEETTFEDLFQRVGVLGGSPQLADGCGRGTTNNPTFFTTILTGMILQARGECHWKVAKTGQKSKSSNHHVSGSYCWWFKNPKNQLRERYFFCHNLQGITIHPRRLGMGFPPSTVPLTNQKVGPDLLGLDL